MIACFILIILRFQWNKRQVCSIPYWQHECNMVKCLPPTSKNVPSPLSVSHQLEQSAAAFHTPSQRISTKWCTTIWQTYFNTFMKHNTLHASAALCVISFLLNGRAGALGVLACVFIWFWERRKLLYVYTSRSTRNIQNGPSFHKWRQCLFRFFFG